MTIRHITLYIISAATFLFVFRFVWRNYTRFFQSGLERFALPTIEQWFRRLFLAAVVAANIAAIPFAFTIDELWGWDPSVSMPRAASRNP